MSVEFSHRQRHAIRMIKNGHRVHKVTLEALFAKGVLVGSLEKPRLNDVGEYFAEHHTLPRECEI